MALFELNNPAPEWTQALALFESRFTYPLGPQMRFRIDHGNDYAGFLKAMGEGIVFIVEKNKKVIGTIGVSLRVLHQPAQPEKIVAYIGDLKVLPEYQHGLVTGRLLMAAYKWCSTRCNQAYSVVMEGTSISPTVYTGRIGIPPFTPIQKISIIRLPSAATPGNKNSNWNETRMVFENVRERQMAPTSYFKGASKELRSLIPCLWISDKNGRCGAILEDTRKVKRLYLSEGNELISAHLSDFFYEEPEEGITLIKEALRRCQHQEIPDLFVTLSDYDHSVLQEWAKSRGEVATATVYGTGFTDMKNLRINSSEV